MAIVRLLYWKEIPTQVRVEDESGSISKILDDRFHQGVDAVAMFDGSNGTDAYLDSWEWGKEDEVMGNPQEIAKDVVDTYNIKFPRDFVARIRELHQSGNRDASPGSIDKWMDDAVI